MYDFDPGASIDKVLVFDGPNQLIETGVSRVVDGPGFDGVPDPTHDLEEGVNLDAGKYYKRRVEQGRHRDKPRTRRGAGSCDPFFAAWSVHQALSSARAHALSTGGFCI